MESSISLSSSCIDSILLKPHSFKSSISLPEETIWFSKILLLKPARFDYKTIDEKNYVGFIAQDYEQVFPEQIKLTEPVGKEAELVDDKVKNISSNLNPYFVLAIQEQHAKITSLEAQLASLKATVDALVASTGHLVV